MKRLIIATALTSTALIGCVAQDQAQDQDDVSEFRKALPSMTQLTASAPQASMSLALGDPALYPTSSYDIVIGINGAVANIIQTMEAVVAIEPTLFNSETREYVWGPFENESGVGYVMAYIKDTAGEGDFRYEYALLRGADNNVANMVPIILGGATPDDRNEDHGAGVTMWDFEANRAFEEANNPDFPNLSLDRGRFVAAYGAGPDENNPNAEVNVVVAAFRNFVPADDAGAAPVDLDYLYGRYSENGQTLDFIDWQTAFDVNDPADGMAEDVGIRMAFFNEGTGRAEAVAANGSLQGDTGEGVECWGNALEQTYLAFSISGTPIITEGTLDSCGVFTATLDELGIPSLADVDPALLGALDQAATSGL